MTDNSGGRECEEEKAGPAVARVSPVTQTTAPATALATSPGGTKLSPPPSYKVNISYDEWQHGLFSIMMKYHGVGHDKYFL